MVIVFALLESFLVPGQPSAVVILCRDGQLQFRPTHLLSKLRSLLAKHGIGSQF
jgi:hypothetical protein